MGLTMGEQEVLEMIKAGNLGQKLSEISNDLSIIIKVLEQYHVGIYGDACIHPAVDFLNQGMLMRGFNHVFPVDDLKYLIEDPNQYKADYHGVSKKHYIAWKSFQRSETKCSAITKKGDQCQAYFFRTGQTPKTPREFDPDKKYYCSIHDRCGVEKSI